MTNCDKLANQLTEFVERWAEQVCPAGCLPTPSQERDVRMFAAIHNILRTNAHPAHDAEQDKSR